MFRSKLTKLSLLQHGLLLGTRIRSIGRHSATISHQGEAELQVIDDRRQPNMYQLKCS